MSVHYRYLRKNKMGDLYSTNRSEKHDLKNFCLSVCLFVVRFSRKNYWTDFDETFFVI